MKVWVFEHTPNIYECEFELVSIHATKKGAKKAKEKYIWGIIAEHRAKQEYLKRHGIAYAHNPLAYRDSIIREVEVVVGKGGLSILPISPLVAVPQQVDNGQSQLKYLDIHSLEIRDGNENLWRELDWRNAAIRLGEELSSCGPNGYYNMNPSEWLAWALAEIKAMKKEEG